ncbi:MAG TPA: nucleotidyltransferase family protein [Pyrinomonadaceae bacterium]|nr:nucleotidyltransferase family protein [Pyrinomonadaceae bacterium]
MFNHPKASAGRLIAQTLTGSWRTVPPPLELEAGKLSAITAQLLGAGVAGLAWRRVRNSHLKETPSAAELRSQYERNTVQAVIQRQGIESIIGALNSAGIESMLVKGLAAARLYGDEGLRPYVDADVCVAQRQIEAAQVALKELSGTGVTVDLHREFMTLGGGDWEAIYSRSQLVKLGESEVRIPSAEDHLRILSIHMLREGAWRPLWLCDVAAAVESRPANFDWNICVGQSRQTSNWINCALKLAHELLGAKITGTPAADDAKPLPQWLTGTVLREWATTAPSMTLRHRSPMASHLRSPRTLLPGFRHRWPNAIEGTIVSRALFNDLPRFPFQLTAYMMRGAHFALGLSRFQRDR